jgi:hypothetical protein
LTTSGGGGGGGVVCFGNQSNLNFKRYIVLKLTACC